MGKQLLEIDAALAAFITAQPIFFVATAPLGGDGHVNCSPKGLDCLRVLGPHTVAYADYTGSGAETIAHLRENGRIVLMWCAFQGPPKIVRVHGQGEVIASTDAEFSTLLGSMGLARAPAIRAIIRMRADRVSSSCGFAVPLLKLEGQRDQLVQWAEHKGPSGLEAYREEKNARSIDGLPAIER